MNIKSFASNIIYNINKNNNNLTLTIGLPTVIDESNINCTIKDKGIKDHLVISIDNKFKKGFNFGVVLDERIDKDKSDITYNNGIITLNAPILDI